MEAMREAWTDDRLDDLADRMDRGFDRVDKDIRELRAETKSEFTVLRGELNERFEAVGARLETINRTMVQAAIGMSAAFIAGFAALVGLVATQL
jgi:hypothetical protein